MTTKHLGNWNGNFYKLTEEAYWVAHKNAHRMAKNGGGFHASLGNLFFKADMSNASKLVNAFPEEFLRPVEANDE